jgi:thiol-disulfide isomerase/thioredoxin
MIRLLAILLLTSTAIGQNVIDVESIRCDRYDNYAEARKESMKTGKPLLVFLTAPTWCTYCKTAKKTIIDPMVEANEFDRCILVVVDVDDEPALFEKIKKQTKPEIPQLVGYGNVEQKTEANFGYLVGEMTKNKVRNLIRKIRPTR